MVVFLFSCTQWCVGQDFYSLHIRLDNEDVSNGYEIIFGEEFTKKYDVSLRNDGDGGYYVDDLSKLEVYLKEMDGDKSVLPGKYSLYGNSKIPVGDYVIIIKYAGNQVLNFDSFSEGKTLSVKARPLEIQPPLGVNFYCTYNGGKQFTMEDFVEVSSEEIYSKDYFVNNCSMGSAAYPLPDFDNTTKIDFDKTTFTFGSRDVTADAQNVEIDWKIKSTDATEDWTSNYDVKTPINWSGYIRPKGLTATIAIQDKKYDGNANINNSQLGNVTLSGVIYGDDVTAKAKSGEYLYPSAEMGIYDKISIPVELFGAQKDNYTCTPAIGSSSIVKEKCPYDIVWKKGEETVDGNVSLTYGAAVGVDDIATQKYYDLVPLMYENGVLKEDAVATLSYSKNNWATPKSTPYDDGDILDVRRDIDRNVISYDFKADFSQYEGCESKIGVKITPYKVSPEPNINKSKVYDGTKDVVTNDDNEIELADFDLRISYTATYNTSDAGAGKTITVEFEELSNDNYELTSQTIEYTDGEIKPIQPVVRWFNNNVPCDEHTPQTINYNNSVSIVSASLYFEDKALDMNYLKDYDLPVYKLELDGNVVDVNSKLDPTKTYTRSVTFNSNNPQNLLPVSSSIKISVEKMPIELQLNGQNVQEFGAKVGGELSYVTVNLSELPSEITYKYFISSNLDISDDDLLTDAYEIAVDMQPGVGKYKFGCIATDTKGYMSEGRKVEPIEITKSSKWFPITPPEIIKSKSYDGNYYAKVEKPAKLELLGDKELETIAYFVDNNSDVQTVTESDFRSDVGSNYYVYYKVVIPEDISNTYRLYINSEMKEDGSIRYYDYFSGDYIDAGPGDITCGRVAVEVEFPNEEHQLVYGEGILGGSSEKDVKVYTMLNGEYFDIDVEWTFEDRTETRSKTYNSWPLDVGTYNNIQAFYIVKDNNSNYCGNSSEKFSITVTPRLLTFDGDLHIDDKIYDGTDIIKSDAVHVPSVKTVLQEDEPYGKGVLQEDENRVKVVYDAANTKYPSAEVGDYDGISVNVSLSGNKAHNYLLEKEVLTASSSIKPDAVYAFKYNVDPINPNDDVKTFRIRYGQSVLGVDFKVDEVTVDNERELDMSDKYVRYVLIMGGAEYDRTFLMQRPNDNDNEYYDIDVQVIKGDRDADALSGVYDIVCNQKIKLQVYKYKLEVSPPDVITKKFYDGNTSVKWVNGNNCVITNAVEGDDVRLDGEPEIAYDTPDVGNHKEISVHYKLIGNHLSRYILPDDIVLEGQIVQQGGIDEVVIQSITPSVSPTEGGYCSGDEVVLNVKFKEGIVDNCNVIFGEQAKKVGFSDLYDVELQSLTDDLYQLAFRCPNATYGTYSAKLQLIDPIDGHTKDSEPFEIKVNYSSDYMKSKYGSTVGYDGDVLVVNNRDSLFVEYQWYKTPFDKSQVFEEKNILREENKQFLYQRPYLQGWYGAAMVTKSGDKVRVCPEWFGPALNEKTSKSYVEKTVLVYPNPASSMEPITIRLNGFETDNYGGVNILIYNSMGSIVKKLTDVDELNTVVLPSGNYSGVVAVDGQTITFKFIVRN